MLPSAIACWMMLSTVARRTGEESAEATTESLGSALESGTPAALTAASAIRTNSMIARTALRARAGKCARLAQRWCKRIARSLTRPRRIRDDMRLGVVAGCVSEFESELGLMERMP